MRPIIRAGRFARGDGMKLTGLRQDLVRRLQLAYSGELGAAIAYRRHASSLSDPTDRAGILRIEAEEREHRARLGTMLERLGASADPVLERRNWVLGSAIARFCQVGGWFCPMYGAGRFERRNIVEYELAARAAVLSGLTEYADSLLDMAEVEWDHEHFLRGKAASHWLSRVLPIWAPPPPRVEIRASFRRFLTEAGLDAAFALSDVEPAQAD